MPFSCAILPICRPTSFAFSSFVPFFVFKSDAAHIILCFESSIICAYVELILLNTTKRGLFSVPLIFARVRACRLRLLISLLSDILGFRLLGVFRLVLRR